MKRFIKISSFVLVAILICVSLTLGVFAEAANTVAEETVDYGKAFSSERLSLAGMTALLGIVMIFSVLAILYIVVSISKIFLYDIPRKRTQRNDAEKEEKEDTPVSVPTAEPMTDAVVEAVPEYAEDDAEIAAAITAAIAVMLSGDEYKNEFAGGFRVVSFKRSATGSAWNKR